MIGTGEPDDHKRRTVTNIDENIAVNSFAAHHDNTAVGSFTAKPCKQHALVQLSSFKPANLSTKNMSNDIVHGERESMILTIQPLELIHKSSNEGAAAEVNITFNAEERSLSTTLMKQHRVDGLKNIRAVSVMVHSTKGGVRRKAPAFKSEVKHKKAFVPSTPYSFQLKV